MLPARAFPLVALLTACGPDTPAGSTAGPNTTTTDATAADSSTSSPVPTTTSTPDDLPGPSTCETFDACDQVDILFVVDNSREMGDAQRRLAAAAAEFVDGIRNVSTYSDAPDYDVQIMVTTTDVGHLLCDPHAKPDYDPARGAPIATPCTARLQRFTSNDGLLDVTSVCESACPQGQVAPADPFIRFHGATDNIIGHQGIGDPVADALTCLLPQGIDGCDMASPLAAIRLALDPEAAWNTGPVPFSRPGAALIIVLVTHRTDCSTQNSDYFDPAHQDDPELSQYWELDPVTMTRTEPTAAICWNAGMTCEPAGADGVYPACAPEEKGVLQPVDEHVAFLRDEIAGARGKETSMVVLGGVPRVSAHNPEPPFFPVKGGLKSLVYRTWREEDINPPDLETPADKEFAWGIGPGCNEWGFGLPPGRIEAVCRSLDRSDDPATPNHNELAQRCCVESICDTEFDPSMCIQGLLVPLRPPQDAPASMP